MYRLLLPILLVLGCWSSGGAVADSGLDRFIEPASFGGGLGVNIHFDHGHRRDVERIAAFGFKIVRADLLWAHIEVGHGTYDWRGPDELVRTLKENHLIPLLILAYSNPLYASRVIGGPPSDSMAYAAPESGPSRAAFMAFVQAAVSRYGDSVLWEVWNEPDHNFGAPVNLRSYIGFAQEACHTLRKVAPNAGVIGPAASGFEWWFLKAFIKADRDRCFDALSVHPYRDEAPESVLRDWWQARALLSDCASSGRCMGLADSEWGYSMTGGAWTAPRQADFDVRLRLLDVMAGVPLSIIYDWQNDGPSPDDKEANFGLLDFHGQPKPAFGALQAMARALNGLRYMGQVVAGRQGDFMLGFGSGDTVRKLVVWTTRDPHTGTVPTEHLCILAGAAGAEYATSCGSGKQTLLIQGSLLLSQTPKVIEVEPGPGGTATMRMSQ